jgi:NADH-quinone oxidoreductase subunit G
VNGQEVEVESGKNLIDALKAVGIEIPHFCYHPALGADGNCRMCCSMRSISRRSSAMSSSSN